MADEPAKLLVIETSGQMGRVGLAVGSNIVAERHLDPTCRHARDLAPAVANLLGTQGWHARDLRCVIVSLGPGSYTGLRVGLMSAKALSFAIGCAIVGVPTFAAIARQAKFSGVEIDVLADARQGKLYVQHYARADSADLICATGELHIVTTAAWVAQRRSDVAVTGPGVRAAELLLPAATPRAAEESWEPQLANVLQVGWDRLMCGSSDDALALEPIYLRPSSAEEQWQRLGR